MALTDLLGIEVISKTDYRVEATMPITPDLYQPFGFLHGGATIALLETVASVGTEQRTDYHSERPFGVDVQIRHRKSGKDGLLHGIAELTSDEPSSAGGRKQSWAVTALDDEGDVISEGAILTRIVPLTRLAEIQRERESA